MSGFAIVQKLILYYVEKRCSWGYALGGREGNSGNESIYKNGCCGQHWPNSHLRRVTRLGRVSSLIRVSRLSVKSGRDGF